VRAVLLPNGKLPVPVEPGPADDTGQGEPFRESGPNHPEDGYGLGLAQPWA
jgi:hypothetical protein